MTTTALICALIAIVLSATMAYFTILSTLAVSYRRQLFDLPDPRRIHKEPTSRLGGFAFSPIIICSTILALVLFRQFVPISDSFVLRYVLLVCPFIFLHIVGLVDDLIGVRYRVKFLAQVIAGSLVVCSGLWIDNLHGLFGIGELAPVLGMPLTVMFIVATINALNLIDGIDGLASGLSIIAVGIFGVSFFLSGEWLFSFLSFAALGVLIPFLYINVWGVGPRKRKLFMGDVGSLTMGLAVSILAIAGIHGTTADAASARADFVLALSPLLVPVFDVVHVVVFRLKNGKHPFLPDRTHVHHRLLGKGFKGSHTVMLILGLALLFTVANVYMARFMNITLVFLIDAAVWVGFNSRLVQPSKSRRARAGARRQDSVRARVIMDK